MLEYMYTGHLLIKEENVFELLGSCHFLQVINDPLLKKCTEWIVQRLNPINPINNDLLEQVN